MAHPAWLMLHWTSARYSEAALFFFGSICYLQCTYSLATAPIKLTSTRISEKLKNASAGYRAGFEVNERGGHIHKLVGEHEYIRKLATTDVDMVPSSKPCPGLGTESRRPRQRRLHSCSKNRQCLSKGMGVWS